PALGESVTEATIAQWYKKRGDRVALDEPLCELETDKVTVELPAQAAGVLDEILIGEGETVEIGALIGLIGEASGVDVPAPAESPNERPNETPAETPADVPPAPAPAAPAPEKVAPIFDAASDLSPAARRVVEEHGLNPAAIHGTGKAGRITKQDALQATQQPAPPPKAEVKTAPTTPTAPAPDNAAREERVRMTRLRKTIAARLKESQNVAAQLTTFNEIDMSAMMAVRTQYKELFEKKFGVRLGFMGFFARACIIALNEIPAVNAEIDGDEIIYKNYVNMGIAVGSPKGLVVPVIKDIQMMGLADIERAIGDYGRKARDGNLALEDLQGGTFTISNGGVYGSLMSTPILNLPQSGVLGMHKIQERAVVIDGEVVARPMMYLALSYDHRLVDGKEAVTFLVRLKESLEAPERMLLDI
ncbi:MAG: 2-oxoglutarate dehydrogenase complex dihydrolipoyllysine-residue succinyltransferase, partial [Parvibaculales bacterium]